MSRFDQIRLINDGTKAHLVSVEQNDRAHQQKIKEKKTKNKMLNKPNLLNYLCA